VQQRHRRSSAAAAAAPHCARHSSDVTTTSLVSVRRQTELPATSIFAIGQSPVIRPFVRFLGPPREEKLVNFFIGFERRASMAAIDDDVTMWQARFRICHNQTAAMLGVASTAQHDDTFQMAPSSVRQAKCTSTDSNELNQNAPIPVSSMCVFGSVASSDVESNKTGMLQR
jgi:hypothetical protein